MGKMVERGRGLLDVPALERRFTELTLLLYDTSVPIPVLEEKVYPHLAPDIEFVDPWVHVRGAGRYRVGLRGFHCIIRFTFDIFQLAVRMNERGDGGRVLVDGVMNLNQLVVYTYPLRTILVYDFVLTGGGESFLVTRQEEMWSFGDMIRNLPVAGSAYEVFRRGAGWVIAGLFWVGCAVTGQGRGGAER